MLRWLPRPSRHSSASRLGVSTRNYNGHGVQTGPMAIFLSAPPDAGKAALPGLATFSAASAEVLSVIGSRTANAYLPMIGIGLVVADAVAAEGLDAFLRHAPTSRPGPQSR